MPDNRNADVLKHIVDYCQDIERAVERFGNDYNIFSEDRVYQNAVALCILQIGELTTHFTEDFKETYNEIPWNQIKALRNLVAHNYGKIDKEILWETIANDIPELSKYCFKVSKQFQTMLQECIGEVEEQI